MSDDSARFCLGSLDDTGCRGYEPYLFVPDILSMSHIHNKGHYQREAGDDVIPWDPERQDLLTEFATALLLSM